VFLPYASCEVAKVTQTWRRYHYSGEGVNVNATHAVYLHGFVADLDGAIAGAMDSMSRMQGVSAFQYDREPLRLGDKVGGRVRFTFNGGQKRYAGDSLFFVRRNESWSVLVLYQVADTTARRFADRVVLSARFNE
jgi:hypothetical protein